MMGKLKRLSFLLIVPACLAGQAGPYLVATSMSCDATASNNSHKMVAHGRLVTEDTIYVVYHSSDSVFYTRSTNRGGSWFPPVFVDRGRYPAIDLDRLNRHHIAWQKMVSGTNDIFYDCLEDTNPPINITSSSGNSTLPDLVVDSNLTTHITWTEDLAGQTHVFYRTCFGGILGDSFRISDRPYCGQASISIFSPNNRLYVLWDCLDSIPTVRHKICRRFKEGNWSPVESLRTSQQVLRRPALDHSHREDVFSGCWEDSSSGNLEATFFGGNGGGTSTSGRSQCPVVSTVGPIWSYLYQMEDSADVLYMFYYSMQGWWGGTIRRKYSIQEPIRFPNCFGDKVIWTQGNAPPFRIFFVSGGYPIKVEEEKRDTRCSIQDARLKILQNPTTAALGVRLLVMGNRQEAELEIYDVAGTLVRSFAITNNQLPITVHWNVCDLQGAALPGGIYFVRLEAEGATMTKKVVVVVE